MVVTFIKILRMKPIILLAPIAFHLSFLAASSQDNSPFSGAWQNTDDSGETICMMDGYLSYARFDVAGKVFHETWGGPYTMDGKTMKISVEFDSKDRARVGKETILTVHHDGNLVVEGMGATRRMKQLDEGKAELAGNWRITGRKQGDKMSEIPLRPRRTFKLLTATRFQWMAINIETGEFSGTGGGSYTFVNGKYTETIEFFSRDNSRVGASLSFDGKLEDGKWHHSGLSSKGEPIYEIWSRHSTD